jgi:hypothetical protein
MCLNYHNETYFTIVFYSQAEQTHHLQTPPSVQMGTVYYFCQISAVMLLEGK